MNVIDTVSGGKESTYMKTFTIDAENNITIHASRKVAKETGLAVFASEEQFAEVIGTDNKRVMDIWNSLAGVKPVTKFANRTIGIQRIWKAIQNLGVIAPNAESSEPAAGVSSEPAGNEHAEEQPSAESEMPFEPQPEQPVATEPEHLPAEPLADKGGQAADVALEQVPVANTTAPAKKSRKAKKSANAEKPSADTPKPEASRPREGSKTSRVVTMLQREQGATISEIMSTMGWQKHTVRGFMAGAMKKAGYTIESFKPEGGERTYRINA
jgi:Protein of unknown function (DUF3489)